MATIEINPNELESLTEDKEFQDLHRLQKEDRLLTCQHLLL